MATTMPLTFSPPQRSQAAATSLPRSPRAPPTPGRGSAAPLTAVMSRPQPPSSRGRRRRRRRRRRSSCFSPPTAATSTRSSWSSTRPPTATSSSTPAGMSTALSPRIAPGPIPTGMSS